MQFLLEWKWLFDGPLESARSCWRQAPKKFKLSRRLTSIVLLFETANAIQGRRAHASMPRLKHENMKGSIHKLALVITTTYAVTSYVTQI
jgi:hypothetical protein